MTQRVAACWVLFALAVLLVAGCATPPRKGDVATQGDQWSGRLSVRVDSDQPQSFTAGFDLKGSALQGQLLLYSPLGATLAQLEWAPGEALLRSDGKVRQFVSLDALTRHATGTALPVASMFEWLAGHAADTAGWHADLRELSNKRLVARRSEPLPTVELRIVLE
ncbi:MAG: outer membrane lipoprotein LolB [Burkholderiaceae bacterium]